MNNNNTSQSPTPTAQNNLELKALKISELRYRRLFETAKDGILLLNADTALIEDVNPYLIELLGYSKSELLGKMVWEVGSFANLQQSKDLFTTLQEEGYVRYEDLPLVTKAGTQINVEFVSNSYINEGIKIIQCNIRNISERKLNETKLLRITNLYSALSQCNKAILHSSGKDEFFLKICRAAVEFGGLKMAWVGMIDENSNMIKPISFYGDGTGYLEDIQISTNADNPLGCGPTGIAIRAKQPYWCHDFQHDPATMPWRARGIIYGWKSSASLPLFINGTIAGCFSFYSDKDNTFDNESRELFMEMATDISFALDKFEQEARHNQSLQEIKFKNSLFQVQQETSLDAILIVDSESQIINYNQKFIELWNLPPELVNEHEDKAVLHSVAIQVRNPTAFVERINYLYDHSKEKSFEKVLLKDGRIIERFTSPVSGNDGEYFGRIWYFRDVTDHVQVAQKLVDSEQRFRSLVEQSIAGILIIQDNKLVYVNPRCAEIIGKGSIIDLVGHDPLNFVAEADRGKVAEAMRILFEKEQSSIALEFEVINNEGITVTVGAHASLANFQTQPAIIGLIQDISEKKRNEESIHSYVNQLKAAFLGTVNLATSMVEMRDPYTAGHERRVAEIAVAIATEMGLDTHRVEGIRIAGYLHDIGKINIPAEILVKPGRLSANEYALVQGHAQSSYDILKHVDFPWPVATIALQHHERIDGSGYPNGLKGDAILLESSIIGVADVVEAMASHRPYRAGLGLDKALAEIERGRGSIYDSAVVDTCLRLFRDQQFVLPPY